MGEIILISIVISLVFLIKNLFIYKKTSKTEWITKKEIRKVIGRMGLSLICMTIFYYVMKTFFVTIQYILNTLGSNEKLLKVLSEIQMPLTVMENLAPMVVLIYSLLISLYSFIIYKFLFNLCKLSNYIYKLKKQKKQLIQNTVNETLYYNKENDYIDLYKEIKKNPKSVYLTINKWEKFMVGLLSNNHKQEAKEVNDFVKRVKQSKKHKATLNFYSYTEK